MAYTTACTTVQAVISLRVLSLQTHRSVMRHDANRKRDILPQVVEVLYSIDSNDTKSGVRVNLENKCGRS